MKGKEGNALFIGPKNRVNEIMRTIQKLTRGGSFGKWDRHNKPTNGFATRGSLKIKTPQKQDQWNDARHSKIDTWQFLWETRSKQQANQRLCDTWLIEN